MTFEWWAINYIYQRKCLLLFEWQIQHILLLLETYKLTDWLTNEHEEKKSILLIIFLKEKFSLNMSRKFMNLNFFLIYFINILSYIIK